MKSPKIYSRRATEREGYAVCLCFLFGYICLSNAFPIQLIDSSLKDALITHNRLRALHHVGPLQWNESLAQQAQQIADTLAVDPSTFHGEDTGENIAQIWHEQAKAAEKATRIWYSEKKIYSFAYPQFSDKVRHFTQLVWKGSKQMGLGAAQNPAGKYVIVVALYRPAGNQANRMRDNVFESGDNRDVYATIKARIPTSDTQRVRTETHGH